MIVWNLNVSHYRGMYSVNDKETKCVCVCGILSHNYLFEFLHIVQVCLLTNAEIEEFLPLVSYIISLSLEM